VGLVLVRRRLSDVQAELRLLQVAVRARDTGVGGQPAQPVELARCEAATATPAQQVASALRIPEDYSEANSDDAHVLGIHWPGAWEADRR
jgi:hypothetical protein